MYRIGPGGCVYTTLDSGHTFQYWMQNYISITLNTVTHYTFAYDQTLQTRIHSQQRVEVNYLKCDNIVRETQTSVLGFYLII